MSGYRERLERCSYQLLRNDFVIVISNPKWDFTVSLERHSALQGRKSTNYLAYSSMFTYTNESTGSGFFVNTDSRADEGYRASVLKELDSVERKIADRLLC